MFYRILISAVIIFSCSSAFSDEKKIKTVGGIDLVYIKSGKFTRGGGQSVDSLPARAITITKGYWIGKFEVTQEQYRLVTGKEPAKDCRYGNGDRLPVYNVSWYDAIEFCNLLSIKNGLKPYYLIVKDISDRHNKFPYDGIRWEVKTINGANGFRLPTEAQWEYAVRAGTSGRFYWGNNYSWDLSGRYSWHLFNAGRKNYKGKRFWWVKYHKAGKVGMKKPNRWGLYDVLGNVAEWCWDRYGKDYYKQNDLTDPSGHEGDFYYRVLRGGSFLDSPADFAVYKRWPMPPNERRSTNGIRVVLPENTVSSE